MSSLPEKPVPVRLLHITPEVGANRLMQEMLNLNPSVSFEHIGTGISAIEQLKQRSDSELPNLIITAWWLPLLNGTDLVTQLKSDSRLRAIPVIVLDSDLPQGEINRMYEAGANCVVQDVADLDTLSRFAEAFRTFWLGVAVLPTWYGVSYPTRPLITGERLTGF
jgi:chemotaxis family two-component system response regulator Rcp1